MQRLEVNCAVRHIYVVSRLRVNIILPSTSGSPQWSLSLRLPHQNPVQTSPLPHTRHMLSPSHSSWFYPPAQYWVRSTEGRHDTNKNLEDSNFWHMPWRMAQAVLGQLDLEGGSNTFPRNDCNNYQSTRRNIPEHFNIRENGCENLQSLTDF
jgi:hypothetical protein